jgi:hypothetical protein
MSSYYGGNTKIGVGRGDTDTDTYQLPTGSGYVTPVDPMSAGTEREVVYEIPLSTTIGGRGGNQLCIITTGIVIIGTVIGMLAVIL